MLLDESLFLNAYSERAHNPFSVIDYCTTENGTLYEDQLDFCTDPYPFKTLLKSRRSGGTRAMLGKFLNYGHEYEGINMAYITLDKQVAKKILWRPLADLNRRLDLGLEELGQEMVFKFPKNNHLYFFSARDSKDISKVLGNEYFYVAVDEAHKIRDHILRELLEENLYPALIDQGGMLDVCGIPPPTDSGYFIELCDGEGFKHFTLKAKRNPFLLEKRGLPFKEIVRQILKLSGLKEDDPTVLRELYGMRIKDLNSLVYKYDENVNSYYQLPQDCSWQYILSCDLGWNDADAICVWGFTEDYPFLYLLHAEEESEQTPQQFIHRCKELERIYGGFQSKVVDAGALGKKIVEGFKKPPYNFHFKAADKTRKGEYIKLMNNDFRNGYIKIKPDNPIVSYYNLLQWDISKNPPIEDQTQKNDLCDAALYGWREANHYNWRQERAKPAEGSTEYLDNMWDKLAKEDKARESLEWWERM